MITAEEFPVHNDLFSVFIYLLRNDNDQVFELK